MILYGHRGARGEAPENTLPGFLMAYRHGIRHFELDLQLSVDGTPVVIHDPTLERTTGVRNKVANLTVKELAELDARRNTAPWPVAVGVPTLEEVLDACPEAVHFQLEVKPDSRPRLNILCNRLTELIQRRQLFSSVVVTSSEGWFLQEIKRRNRRIRTGYVAGRRFPRPLATARRLDCSYLIPNWKLCSPQLVRQAQRYDMKVSVWTVNRIHDMVLMEQMGVDSIITDFPTSTRIYFENRSLRLPPPADVTDAQADQIGSRATAV